MSSRPKAILFDWDSTLIDNWRAIHAALNATLVAFGQEPWPYEEMPMRVRASQRDAFPKLFGERWQEARTMFYGRFEATHLEYLQAMAGAQAMLEHLQNDGFYLAVVSNKAGPYLRKEAAHLGWEKYFSHLIGATDAARDKPAPDPIDMALDGSRIARGPEVWYVGDGDIDLECAHNAGCVSVLIRAEPPRPDEFPQWPPRWHVRSCTELSALVKGLPKDL